MSISLYKKVMLLVWIGYISVSALSATPLQGGQPLYLHLQDTTIHNYKRYCVMLENSIDPGRKYCVSMQLHDPVYKIWKITPPSGLWSDKLDIRIDVTEYQDCRGKTYKIVTGEHDHLHNFFVSNPSLGSYWSCYIPAPTVSPKEENFSESENIVVDYCSSVRNNFSYTPHATTPYHISSIKEIYEYRWFQYSAGRWKFVDTLWLERKDTAADASTVLLPNRLDTTFFVYSASRYPLTLNSFVNFSPDNLNFSSSYFFNSTNINETGTYTIITNLNGMYNAPSKDIFDHTIGDGSDYMLAVHCNQRDNAILWKQTFDSIQPNTDYLFSFWVMRWNNQVDDSVELDIEIGETIYKKSIFIPSSQNRWSEIRIAWTSGEEDTTSTFSIINRTTRVNGSDIAFDDISLRKKEEIQRLVKVYYDDITSQHVDDTIHFCDTLLPYQWHGQEISKKGDYFDTLRNDMDCDTAFFSLHFLIERCCPPIRRHHTVTPLCDTLIPYPWHNQTIEEDGIYYFFATDYKGCDSIYDTLQTTIVKCANCYYDLMYRKWEDLLFVDNPNDSFISYQWFHNNIPLVGETKQYYFTRDTLSGYYHVAITDKNNVTKNSCTLYYADIPYSISTYPVEDEESSVVVYNHLGRIVYKGDSTNNRTIPSSLPDGLYIMIEYGKEKGQTFKIIKTGR